MTTRRYMRRTALAVALGMALASTAAHAQQTVGNIFGTADGGAAIHLTNTDNGTTRTITAAADGTFTFNSLRPGDYTVTATENGKTVTRRVVVIAGQGNVVNLTGEQAQQLQAVHVTANALPAIDVSTVRTDTILTARQLNTLPIGRNETAVALLAPGVTSGDPSVGGLTIDGSSIAENAYYVNGFPVINQFRSLSFAQVPYEAIAQQQIRTGGYGAKFGYATGGVISVVTKRGTNTWHGGARVDWVPDSLSAHDPDLYLDNGKLNAVNENNDDTQTTYAAWLGGPIIKNRLFIYALAQQTRDVSDTYGAWNGFPTSPTNPPLRASALHGDDHSPYWLVKLDWNINDSNIIEYTGFNDRTNAHTSYYYANYNAGGAGSKGAYQGSIFTKQGGQTNIFKYTGYLTDNFTLTAQYGRMVNDDGSFGIDANPAIGKFAYHGDIHTTGQGCPQVIDERDPVNEHVIPAITGCSWAPPGMNRVDAQDVREDSRLDIDWVLGDHDIRAGYDYDQWTSLRGNEGYSGGALWLYVGPDANPPFANNLAIAVHFNTGADIKIVQKAWYLEDHWHVTPNFLLYLGVRNDTFENFNGSGTQYVSQKNVWQPRVGFSWDVGGDATFKVYGSVGLYTLPIAATVSLRGAAASIFNEVYYLYDSVDPVTGVPHTTANLGQAIINGAAGNTPPAGAVASHGLKPIQVRSFALGFQKQIFGNWTFGIKATQRSLINTIDDYCDWKPFHDWGIANNLSPPPTTGAPPTTMPGCWILNPGKGARYSIDVNGDGTLDNVVLTPQEIGLPKARRKYLGVTFSLGKQLSNNWYVRASYLWSHNYGNTEGLIKSDFNNAQTDTGTTQDFDFPLLMVGATGNLPNDRRNTFKLYGQFTTDNQEWTFGGNLLVQSGRPENCFGVNPTAFQPAFASVAPYLGNPSFLACRGTVVPRGSIGFLPWLINFDVGVTWAPNWARGLQFQVNMINVFNRRAVIKRNEGGEVANNAGPGNGNTTQLGGGFAANDPTNSWLVTQFFSSTYGTPIAWQQPRYIRISVGYSF